MWILNAVKMFVCGEITAEQAKEMVNQMDKKFDYNMDVMAMQATDNKDKLNVEQECNRPQEGVKLNGEQEYKYRPQEGVKLNGDQEYKYRPQEGVKLNVEHNVEVKKTMYRPLVGVKLNVEHKNKFMENNKSKVKLNVEHNMKVKETMFSNVEVEAVKPIIKMSKEVNKVPSGINSIQVELSMEVNEENNKENTKFKEKSNNKFMENIKAKFESNKSNIKSLKVNKMEVKAMVPTELDNESYRFQ